MMRFNVDDVREWQEHVNKIVVAGDYKSVRVIELEEIGDTMILHVTDPAGILLIFVQ